MIVPWQINSRKLRLLNVVGHGEFGLVRKAVLVSDGKLVDVAVKMIEGNVITIVFHYGQGIYPIGGKYFYMHEYSIINKDSRTVY